MALEQMIVMGAAFGWLFVRMLAEADRQDMRSERFQSAAPTNPEPRVEAEVAPSDGRIRLGDRASRLQLEEQGATLREGLRILIVTREREVHGVARWDAEWGGWFAELEPPAL
jgi:hypothetical protein